MSVENTINKQIFEKAKKCVYAFYKLDDGEFYKNIKSRKEAHVKPRRMLACLCRTINPDFPYADIGWYFVRQNHVTIMNLVKKCMGYIETEKKYKIEFNKILQLYINGLQDAPLDRQHLKDKFFYVNLNDCKVLRYNMNKSVVFSGISDEQIEAVKKILGDAPLKTFYDTGVSIFKAKK